MPNGALLAWPVFGFVSEAVMASAYTPPDSAGWLHSIPVWRNAMGDYVLELAAYKA